MDVIGIIVTVLFGSLLCFAGGFAVFAKALLGGGKGDVMLGSAMIFLGAVIVVWTLYENVSIQVTP